MNQISEWKKNRHYISSYLYYLRFVVWWRGFALQPLFPAEVPVDHDRWTNVCRFPVFNGSRGPGQLEKHWDLKFAIPAKMFIIYIYIYINIQYVYIIIYIHYIHVYYIQVVAFKHFLIIIFHLLGKKFLYSLSTGLEPSRILHIYIYICICIYMWMCRPHTCWALVCVKWCFRNFVSWGTIERFIWASTKLI